MTHDNKLQVEAIKRGTVIDHIPAQVGFKLLTLFKLTETDQRITIGLNLPSGEMGRKDLIKIENTFLTDEQVNQLSLYAPQATVNRIDDYEVVGKSRPSLPDRIDSVLVCPNSNCISHAEPVSSSFAVKKRADDIALKCKYCEKEFSHYVVLAQLNAVGIGGRPPYNGYHPTLRPSGGVCAGDTALIAWRQPE
ncbi:aspartate carbamoyltransferase [Klebsiella pneumoniae subsp. ozaenae]|uniref:Aspartate carbamoyltransferase regulatory chain n=10 Tax=Pseudomonadati TaxID=3379134 RepID=A0A378B085_KLEPO|nr:aspartate carbamoyltransferase [Klebsiella pneumoniae subsp. ozaenae]